MGSRRKWEFLFFLFDLIPYIFFVLSSLFTVKKEEERGGVKKKANGMILSQSRKMGSRV